MTKELVSASWIDAGVPKAFSTGKGPDRIDCRSYRRSFSPKHRSTSKRRSIGRNGAAVCFCLSCELCCLSEVVWTTPWAEW